MILRTLQSADLPAYAALFQRVFAQPPWQELWTLEAILCDIARTMNRTGFVGLVAEEGSRGVGYAVGYSVPVLRWFYLEQLFVDDRCRGAGIGRHLLAEVVARSPRPVVLLTKPDSPADRFYRANEFVRTLRPLRLRVKVLMRNQNPS